MTKARINNWIKTPCGRAKYAELASNRGLIAGIRLGWFVVFAAIKDWNLATQDQIEESKS